MFTILFFNQLLPNGFITKELEKKIQEEKIKCGSRYWNLPDK
jgi:hypothetical protein